MHAVCVYFVELIPWIVDSSGKAMQIGAGKIPTSMRDYIHTALRQTLRPS